jgi:Tfp pilus assembly protein PilN
LISTFIKFILTILIYLSWNYAGGSLQESLFISLVFLGVLLLRPIPFQSSQKREELLEKMQKNYEQMKELQRIKKEEKKQIDQDALNRSALRTRKEEKKQTKSE